MLPEITTTIAPKETTPAEAEAFQQYASLSDSAKEKVNLFVQTLLAAQYTL